MKKAIKSNYDKTIKYHMNPDDVLFGEVIKFLVGADEE